MHIRSYPCMPDFRKALVMGILLVGPQGFEPWTKGL